MKSFTDNPNTAVITTKFVLEQRSPILHVFHYEDDGSWQFSEEETNLKDEDFRVISLEEIISIDPTILDISDLPLGEEAYRIDIDSPWKIEKYED
jgi:hypothetical protein